MDSQISMRKIQIGMNNFEDAVYNIQKIIAMTIKVTMWLEQANHLTY